MCWIFDCTGYSSYVWEICLMYVLLVLCIGYLAYIFGENQNHASLGCNYGGVYCLVVGAGLVEGCKSCRRMQVLSFWEKIQKHMSPGCNYGEVYCLVIGCKSCQRMQVLS